ncbi:TIGR00266 family protein [Aquimarina sp. 2201CG14-23]|uniref:TIGR00266 family protein n=1 Tax=Aquimarina mycalae TaxID=3040073 RepID=UPI0024780DB7|nr:TIGR00266 family protein [Aquimarina sp. 2201CG14-23]MDH7448015.1 TIGR00266 family protein [Aquimarina sp. 2201CG14-23]
MNTKILGYPNSYLEVQLEEGEEFIVEKGGMILANGSYELETKIEAKTVNNWVAKIVGGKSLTYNIYKAKSALTMLFSPGKNADLFEIDVQEEDSILIEADVHFGRTKNLNLVLAKQGFKNTLNDGLKLRTIGSGALFLIGFGKILKHNIDSDTPILVDQDALIAYDERLEVKTVSKGLKELVTSGEGYLFEIKGKGRIWLQTREEESKSGGGGIISSILDIFR